MKEIIELEAKLKKAKEDEYLANRIKELSDIKKVYEGRCYGSNLFNRIHKSRNFSLKYYEKFYIKENEIFVLEWILYGNRYPAFYKSETPTYNLNSYINERKLTGGEYNATYTLDSDFSFYKKEIQLSEFMSLWKTAKECYEIIRDTFKQSPQLEIEDIRQSEHANEQSIEKIISELGMDMIDLKQYPKMFWIFEYKTLPMLQNGRWLPKIYAKQLLEYVIKDYEKDNRSPWSSLRSINYNNERINTIKEFINTEL